MEIKEVTEEERELSSKHLKERRNPRNIIRTLFTTFSLFYFFISFIVDTYKFFTDFTLGTGWLNVPFVLIFISGMYIFVDEIIEKIKTPKDKKNKSGCSKCSKKRK
tara:strand:- start:2233 stop:2550 length:318 start_codon:yes stop_codon:yes gene_type:complete